MDEVSITDTGGGSPEKKIDCRVPVEHMIEHAINAERDYVDGKYETIMQRFADMDKATELLSATVNRVPTDLTKGIQDIMRLMDERDLRVQHRFDANEKLSLTESNLNQTALAAALAAQEKASAVSTGSLESLIKGQGAATDRTIEKNAELAAAALAALGARVTELAQQVTRTDQRIAEITAGKVAVAEQKIDTRGGVGSIYGAIGVAVGILSIIIAAVSIIIATR
jgi:hypothetical protein